MTLLLRDPDAKTGAPAPGAPCEAAPEVATCPRCQAPLEPGQDWCLSCGEAQPGRLASLPGKRAAATVVALTTLLVGGAVAASYAALQDQPAQQPATPTQLAQVPSAATPPAAAAPAAPSTPAPEASTPAPASGGGALPDSGSTPATPSASSTPSTSAGTSSTATGSTGTSGTTTGSSGTGRSSSGSSDSTASTRTTTTPADTAPTPINLDATAAALYDPYTRNTVPGDIAKALDGNPTTSFPITVAEGATSIGAGIVVDLGKTRGLRELDLTTKTPGFKLELYATDSEELPPDVLDTRWAHLRDVASVGNAAGGKEIVSLGSGTTKYRHVLLWFTTPPTDGLTVRASEIKLLG